MTAAAGSGLVAALELVWEAIRGRCGEVPEVVVVVAAGSEGKQLKLGHYAASRWHLDGGERAEVLVGGEGLRCGAVDVLGTLLHEAAHGLAQTRGVKDTSRGGRYHNRRYRALAEELGLEVAETPPIGWSATTVPEATVAGYAAAVAALNEALVLWRVAERPRRAELQDAEPAGMRVRVPAPDQGRAGDAGPRPDHLHRMRPAVRYRGRRRG